MRYPTRISGLLLLTALPIACSGSGSSDSGDPSGPFQFRTSEDSGVAVTVTRYGVPVSGASVSIVEARTLAEIDGAENHGLAFFSGGTDPDGVCASVIAIPTRVERVDVVVHHDGSRGPYTDEALREYWGPFAPSSRQTVRVADLGNLTVALEDR